MRIKRELSISKTVLDILKKSSEYYKLEKTNLIELLFIISISNDQRKIVNSPSNNEIVIDNTKQRIFVRLNEDTLKEMYEVAGYYNATLSKYIELLVMSKQENGLLHFQ